MQIHSAEDRAKVVVLNNPCIISRRLERDPILELRYQSSALMLSYFCKIRDEAHIEYRHRFTGNREHVRSTDRFLVSQTAF